MTMFWVFRRGIFLLLDFVCTIPSLDSVPPGFHSSLPGQTLEPTKLHKMLTHVCLNSSAIEIVTVMWEYTCN